MLTETGSPSRRILDVDDVLDVDDEPLSLLEEQNQQAATMSIHDIVTGIKSGDPNKEITATHAAACMLLYKEKNPEQIDILIDANVVPKLVEFLGRPTKQAFQYLSKNS